MTSDSGTGRISQSHSKKPYTPPHLLEYGSVAKLTQNGHSSITSDSGSNNMSRFNAKPGSGDPRRDPLKKR